MVTLFDRAVDHLTDIEHIKSQGFHNQLCQVLVLTTFSHHCNNVVVTSVSKEVSYNYSTSPHQLSITIATRLLLGCYKVVLAVNMQCCM